MRSFERFDNERGDGEIPSGQDQRRDERLHLVAAQLGVGRRHARPAEVDEAEPAVVIDEQVGLVDLAVGDRVVVEALDEVPEFAHPLQGMGTAEPLDRSAVSDVTSRFGRGDQRAGPPEHEQGVVARRRSGDHHLIGRHAGLTGEQRQECFVFHLPQPPETDR